MFGNLSTLKSSLLGKTILVVLASQIFLLSFIGYIYQKRIESQIDQRIQSKVLATERLLVDRILDLESITNRAIMHDLFGEGFAEGFTIQVDSTIGLTSHPNLEGLTLNQVPDLDPAWFSQSLARSTPHTALSKDGRYGYHVIPIQPLPPYETQRLAVFKIDLSTAIREKQEALRDLIFLMVSSLLLTSAILVFSFYRSVAHRLSNCLNLLKSGREGNLATRAPADKKGDELSLLSENINALLSTLERDFNHLKNTESALRESERYNRMLFETSPIGLALCRMSGELIDVNEAFAKMIGRNIPETLGLSYQEITPKQYEADEKFQLERLKSTGFYGPFEKEYFHRDGTLVPVRLWGRAILRNDEPLIWSCVENITDARRADEEKRLLERKLQENQQLKSLGVLAGGVAHDFNNLLTSILGNANLARIELPEDHHKLHGYLSRIEKSSQKAADLCQQMLAYAGKGRFVMKPLDLNELVRESAILLNRSIETHGQLSIHYNSDLPKIFADPSQIKQILLNLVINAAEALPDQHGKILIKSGETHLNRDFLQTLRFGAELSGGIYVYFEVTDTGQGMTPETVSKIFDPFFTTRFTGRGLGLAAVSGIVRSHKGAIEVISAPDLGSTFRIYLPAHTEVPYPIPDSPSYNDTQTTIPKTLLIIDDEEDVRTITAELLLQMGFTVIVAASGQEGIKTFKQQAAEIDLVLLDYTMPGFDGPQTLEKLLPIKPQIKVILMSGYGEQLIASNGQFFSKIHGFIQKPFQSTQLKEKIQQTLSLPTKPLRDHLNSN